MLKATHYSNNQPIYQIQDDQLTYYYKNGAVKAVGAFFNEMMEGKWHFYKETGQLFQIGHFYHEHKHGSWIRYDKNNQIEFDEIFDLGKKIKKHQQSIQESINQAPIEYQDKLHQLYLTIQQAAPLALETFSYGMPTFILGGNLVHFALAKNHIGFYPGPSGVTHFTQHNQSFQTSKGAIQFPLDQLLPLEDVIKVVTFRVEENLSKIFK